MTLKHLYARAFNAACALLLFISATGLASCSTTPKPEIAIQHGNQLCHPSSDLPARKAIKAVPETDTLMGDVYHLFGIERHDHYRDVQDYNKLWTECVDPAIVPVAPSPAIK